MTPHRKIAEANQALGHRLFIAIQPGAAEAARIGVLRDGLGSAGSRVRTDRLHITMAILDDLPFMPPHLVDAVMGAVASVEAPPVQITLDRLVASGRTACLVPDEGLPALKALQAQMAAALRRAGVPLRRGWRFSPHVTLLYDPQNIGGRAIMPIGWKAEEFVLIHSLVGLTRHIILDRWPLIEQPRLL